MRPACRRRPCRLAGWYLLAASGSAQLGSAAAFWGRRTGPDGGVSGTGKQHWGGRPPRIDLASANPGSTTAFAQQNPRTSDVEHDVEKERGDESSSSPSPSSSTVHCPERGKILKELTPEQMYGAYRDIQLDYQRRAFSSEGGEGSGSGSGSHHWKVLNERDGVKVSLLQHPDDPHCPYVRMNGIIDAPVQHCWDFLKVDRWDESMPKMDPFYEGVTVLGEYSHPESGVDMILCRKRTKRILAFGKRDLVFLSVVDNPLEDGTWVSGSVSVVTPHVPRHPGYTRAFQDSIAFYQPLDNNTRTTLTIVCRIDLNDSGRDGSGGWIPMWLYVKTIGVTAVESVLRMRHAIVGQLQQQQE